MTLKDFKDVLHVRRTPKRKKLIIKFLYILIPISIIHWYSSSLDIPVFFTITLTSLILIYYVSKKLENEEKILISFILMTMYILTVIGIEFANTEQSVMYHLNVLLDRSSSIYYAPGNNLGILFWLQAFFWLIPYFLMFLISDWLRCLIKK